MENLKLALKKNKEQTIVKINGVEIGRGFTVIAGPCAVENREQLFKTAEIVKEAGADIMRGGAFKPRSNPYSFQGLGEEGLQLLKEAKEKFKLPVVTEVMDSEDIEMVERYADIIQVGTRNAQNFSMLKKLGKSKKPILLKRGMANTIEEFLASAEYILKEGNPNVILCERGIRTFEGYTRFTPDIAAIAVIKQISHLPIVFDPSHSTGKPELVLPLSKAAKAAGADGIIVEVHYNPEQALCDGRQSLNEQQFKELMKELQAKDI